MPDLNSSPGSGSSSGSSPSPDDLSDRFASFIGNLSDDDALALLGLVEGRVSQNARAGSGETAGGQVVPIQHPASVTCANCKVAIRPGQGYGSPYKPPRKFVFIMGVRGVEETEKVVCRACYRLDFKRVYPGERVPV